MISSVGGRGKSPSVVWIIYVFQPLHPPGRPIPLACRRCLRSPHQEGTNFECQVQ